MRHLRQSRLILNTCGIANPIPRKTLPKWKRRSNVMLVSSQWAWMASLAFRSILHLLFNELFLRYYLMLIILISTVEYE